ncbi:uncharacterized protein TRUGW13939_06789 [Talaromyces rugulosus]|uniref:Uncharacterized protein n=1 Tax=Talaromyces rugulosus TaxID=121627 RepID=A0A7H8QZY8_TALRU|nr:uncharacterized protein TRUGW13939_06789 [Talaromyces rugulosus]QKX59652.1 hypothetical protein TRUGW13939_06789 [Talaromyces rugulosus]
MIQVESAQRSVEESEDSFIRTRAVGNLFSDEDDDDEDHILPNEGRSLEPLAGLASYSGLAHGENDADSLIYPLDNETADASPRVHDGRSNDCRRNVANRIRQQRLPGTPIFHEQLNRIVIFWVWTGLWWSERTKVDLGASDPLQVEWEACRFVEHYYANLRDAH